VPFRCTSKCYPPSGFLATGTFQRELAGQHLTALDKPMLWMQSSSKRTVTHSFHTALHNRLKSRGVSLPWCIQWVHKYERSNRRHPHHHKISIPKTLCVQMIGYVMRKRRCWMWWKGGQVKSMTFSAEQQWWLICLTGGGCWGWMAYWWVLPLCSYIFIFTGQATTELAKYNLLVVVSISDTCTS
jgi:hypothetical protein